MILGGHKDGFEAEHLVPNQILRFYCDAVISACKYLVMNMLTLAY
jgi:hypothetical protein